MNCFPLYDTLIAKNIPKKDLSMKQKEEFISKISTTDMKGKQITFSLICVHYMKDNKMEYLPYNCSCSSPNNYSWNFADFPISLRHILYRYIIMHTNVST